MKSSMLITGLEQIKFLLMQEKQNLSFFIGSDYVIAFRLNYQF